MKAAFNSRYFRSLLVAFVCIMATGCGAGAFDPSTVEGKRAILDATNIALSNNNCDAAIAQVSKPLYQTQYTDNEVRMITASAYACKANFNFFKFISDLVNENTYLLTGFWGVLAKLFPSKDRTDYTVESALLATDALMATIKPGAVMLPTSYINTNLDKTAANYNLGSVYSSDRLEDANTLLLFVSMAAMGALENRYANIDPLTHKGALPWTTLDSLNSSVIPSGYDGCAYASEVVNFIDTVVAVAKLATGDVQGSLNTLTLITEGLFLGCDQGCKACDPTSSCATCPAALRDRTQCKGVATDPVSCAAAGMINAINATWTLGGAVP